MIHVIANKMESAVPPTSALGDADDEDDNGDDGDVHNNSDEWWSRWLGWWHDYKTGLFLASAKEARPELMMTMMVMLVTIVTKKLMMSMLVMMIVMILVVA